MVIQKPHMFLGLVIYLGKKKKNSKVNRLNAKTENMKQTEDIELTKGESPRLIVKS